MSVDQEAFKPGKIEFRLDEPLPPTGRDAIDQLRWVLDAKVRALAALCGLQSSGKGDDTSRKTIHDLADQVSKVPIP